MLSAVLSAALVLLSGMASASGAVAQVWQSRTNDSGALISGAAYVPDDYRLQIACTAPSPQGIALIQTGDHESHRTDPYEIYIRTSDLLFEWEHPYQQVNTVMRVSGRDFRLPVIDLNELQGSAVYLPMSHALVQALTTATSLQLITPQGVVHDLPTQGLGVAMHSAFHACVRRWAEMGHSTPGTLRPYLAPPQDVSQPAPAETTPAAPGVSVGIPRFDLPPNAARTPLALAPSQPTAPPLGRKPPVPHPGMPQVSAPQPGVPLFGVPLVTAPAPQPAPAVVQAATSIAELPPVITEFLYGQCLSGTRIGEDALRAASDLDGDGLPDYVIHYTAIYCQPHNLRDYCGAANCSIQIFVSSRNYIRPFEFLGLDVNPVRAPDGRPGLQMSGTQFICNNGDCDGIWIWNGETFVLE